MSQSLFKPLKMENPFNDIQGLVIGTYEMKAVRYTDSTNILALNEEVSTLMYVTKNFENNYGI